MLAWMLRLYKSAAALNLFSTLPNETTTLINLLLWLLSLHTLDP